MRGLRAWLDEPVPAHSLAALRIAFGIVMLVATIRFAANGWIDSLFVAPPFHFTYYGFSWVRPLPSPLIYAHFAVIGIAAACVALGVYHRVSSVVFLVAFAYAELIDVATYLNHYYAITIVALLLAATPAANVLSVDAWRARKRGEPLAATIPRASIFVFRAQLTIIYVFAGIAKLGSDWLVRGEPLATWLYARSDLPIVGPLLARHDVALAMSWAGAAFDLSIPLWLSLSRTRRFAYVAVVVFHVATGVLFSIGMFPWIMIALTPIFFAPEWPLALARRPAPIVSTGRPLPKIAFAALALWLAIQVALPMRHWLYRGDVLETEEGFRYAWLVMIVERQGSATFRVSGSDGVERTETADDLTDLQRRMMATQADLILAYAHHLRDRHAAHGEPVHVYADAFVSTNGRPRRRWIDPHVDLAAESHSLFGFDWVLP
jgi:hypothetical protein